MFHYSLNFSKETEPGKVSLPFCFEADMALPVQEARKEWITAISDPDNSWLWPREYSIPHLEQAPISVGGFFHLIYQMPDPTKPDQGSTEYRYDYSIVRWEPDTLLFQYQAEFDNDRVHPFSGGGTVTITEVGPGISRLKWAGAYHHTGNRQSAEDVFANFFTLFFTSLAKNIRRHHGLTQQ